MQREIYAKQNTCELVQKSELLFSDEISVVKGQLSFSKCQSCCYT